MALERSMFKIEERRVCNRWSNSLKTLEPKQGADRNVYREALEWPVSYGAEVRHLVSGVAPTDHP